MAVCAVVQLVLLTLVGVSVVSCQCPAECVCVPSTDPNSAQEQWTVNCVEVSNIPLYWPMDIQPIRELYFTNIDEAVFPTRYFSNFTACIQKISIRFSKIGVIESGAFSGLRGCGSDAVLMLGYNEIETIGHNAFAGLSNMASIQIIGGSIGTIQSQAFTQVQIGSIIVSGVTIGQLDSNAFAGSVGFQTGFDLPSALNAIPEDAINFFPELDDTGFTGCENVAIEDSKRSFVSFISNTIDRISSSAFTGVQSPTLLNLYGNTIGQIQSQMFGKHGKADLVFIAKNVIEGLADLAFQGLDGSRKFVLNKNNVSCAGKEALGGIEAESFINKKNTLTPVEESDIRPNCQNLRFTTTTTSTTTSPSTTAEVDSGVEPLYTLRHILTVMILLGVNMMCI